MGYKQQATPFRYHMHSIGSWIYSEESRTAGPIELFFRTCWDRYLSSSWDPIVCRIRGHKWADADPGDPEVGPQPYIYCRWCGRTPSE